VQVRVCAYICVCMSVYEGVCADMHAFVYVSVCVV